MPLNRIHVLHYVELVFAACQQHVLFPKAVFPLLFHPRHSAVPLSASWCALVSVVCFSIPVFEVTVLANRGHESTPSALGASVSAAAVLKP